MELKHKNWRTVKVKIILKYGSVAQCARELECSNEAIRQTVDGRCKGVAAKLARALKDVEMPV